MGYCFLSSVSGHVDLSSSASDGLTSASNSDHYSAIFITIVEQVESRVCLTRQSSNALGLAEVMMD